MKYNNNEKYLLNNHNYYDDDDNDEYHKNEHDINKIERTSHPWAKSRYVNMRGKLPEMDVVTVCENLIIPVAMVSNERVAVDEGDVLSQLNE